MSQQDLSTGTLFILQARPPAVIALSADGKERKVLGNLHGTPDGIYVDADTRTVYWTNMGSGVHLIDTDEPAPPQPPNDGTVECAQMDGTGHQVLVQNAGTPKELKLDKDAGYMYWCDREGMRVMRARIDGSNPTALVVRGQFPQDTKDATRHCVGIAIDKKGGHLYWTQKGPPDAGQGRIFRIPLGDVPAGMDPANRSDIELLMDKLPEPIDLDIDTRTHTLYWTDRGNLKDGNTLNRAKMGPEGLTQHEVVARGLDEGIGVSLDVEGRRAFTTDLGGNVNEINIDTKEEKPFTRLAHLGVLTGLEFVRLND